MKFFKMLKKLRRNYVINQVRKVEIPEFQLDKIVRYNIIFSGRVQKVGFRLEIEQLSLRLELTGWIRNLENGNVEMEIQGIESKINFLLKFMNSLIRIKINHMDKKEIIILNQEQGFRIL